MDAVCLGKLGDYALLRGARILRGPPRLCTYQTRIVPVQQIEVAYQVQVHNSCGCNELRALTRRHLVQHSAGFDKVYFRSKIKAFLEQRNLKNIKRYSYTQVIEGYSGAKKRRYKEAYYVLQGEKRIRAWSAVQMFVKPDRLSAENVYDKEPRAIQFRHPCFNLMLAKFLKPFEHTYYQQVDWTGQRIVAKGSNNLERASNIVEAAALFKRPVFVLLDHSKFDAHVNVHHLRFLHRAYDLCFRDGRLTRLLQYQINNRGFSKAGIRYKVKATRMSGDYDTGLGNTLLNDYLIYLVFGHVKYHVLLDGDDSVVIVEKEDLSKVDIGNFLRLGMETKCEIVHELHQVEFCRAKLLPLNPPRFARDPVRALSNMSMCFKHYSGDGYLRYIAGLGIGEASASNGVPVIGPIAWKMSLAHSRPILDENIQYMYGAPGHPLCIDDEARRWLHDQYGMAPAMQIEIERSFNTPRGVCLLRNKQFYQSLPLGPSSVFV